MKPAAMRLERGAGCISSGGVDKVSTVISSRPCSLLILSTFREDVGNHVSDNACVGYDVLRREVRNWCLGVRCMSNWASAVALMGDYSNGSLAI